MQSVPHALGALRQLYLLAALNAPLLVRLQSPKTVLQRLVAPSEVVLQVNGQPVEHLSPPVWGQIRAQQELEPVHCRLMPLQPLFCCHRVPRDSRKNPRSAEPTEEGVYVVLHLGPVQVSVRNIGKVLTYTLLRPRAQFRDPRIIIAEERLLQLPLRIFRLEVLLERPPGGKDWPRDPTAVLGKVCAPEISEQQCRGLLDVR
mmetsp:Transcript_10303/g.31504  ORF Transcript_10303/g.31504 Transcript_10303/m.31504 type:complete len:202 (-) Transcript_10303:1142-1747(-)